MLPLYAIGVLEIRPDEATVERRLRAVRAAHLPAADADVSR
ncbi:hypothetical protein [Micromonospora wenchangensis]